jgi:putative peptidoglycan binding protein
LLQGKEKMLGRKILISALMAGLAAGTCVFAEATTKRPQSTTGKKKSSGSSATNGSKTSGSKTGSAKSRGKKTSKTSRKKGQQVPTTDRVSEIQTALAKDGSYSGEPNGKWDASSVEALRKFQSGHGLNPTGRLDAPTLQKLGLGSTTAGVAAPQTPPGAVSRLTSSKFNTSSEPASEDQQ